MVVKNIDLLEGSFTGKRAKHAAAPSFAYRSVGRQARPRRQVRRSRLTDRGGSGDTTKRLLPCLRDRPAPTRDSKAKLLNNALLGPIVSLIVLSLEHQRGTCGEKKEEGEVRVFYPSNWGEQSAALCWLTRLSSLGRVVCCSNCCCSLQLTTMDTMAYDILYIGTVMFVTGCLTEGWQAQGGGRRGCFSCVGYVVVSRYFDIVPSLCIFVCFVFVGVIVVLELSSFGKPCQMVSLVLFYEFYNHRICIISSPRDPCVAYNLRLLALR